jgi:hypothetical protein
MRGRLPIIFMALVALALVLSLVATLAPGAIAQDSGAAPDGAARWMRYNMPAAQDLGAATYTNGFLAQPKNCCITIQSGCTPMPSSGVNAAPAAATTSMPLGQPRWFCNDAAE